MKVMRRAINKTLQQIMIACVSIMMLTGCGNSLFNKAMEQGKLAVENQDYGKAKSSFELALEEKEDTDARNMLQQVDNMILGLTAKDDSNVEEAIKYFSEVISEEISEEINEDSVFESMQEEAKQSKIQLQQLQDKINEYEEDILKAANMLKEKSYSESKNILNQVIESTKEHTAFVAQHNKAQDTLNLVHTEVTQLEADRQEEARKAAEEKALLEAIKNPINPTVTIGQVAKSKGYDVGDYKLADLNKDGVKDYIAIVTKSSDTCLMVIDGSTGGILATEEIYPGDYGNSLEVYNAQGNYHIVESCNDLYASYSLYQWNNGKLVRSKDALSHEFDITLESENILRVKYQPAKYSQNFSIPYEAYMELAADGELNWYSTSEVTIRNNVLLRTHSIILTSPHEYVPLIITEKSNWNGSKWVLDKVEYTTLEYDFYSDQGEFKI